MKRARSWSHPAIVLTLVGSTLTSIYTAALWRFPLLDLYDQRLQNLNKLTQSDPQFGLLLAGSVLMLFVAYFVGALVLYRHVGQQCAGGWLLNLILIGFPLFCGCLLLFVYPITSLDIYDYLFRGRMLVRHGANTFLATPEQFASDPLLSYIAWRRAVTAYGPLWESVSRQVAALAGERRCLEPAVNTLCAEAAPQVALLRLLLAYKGLGLLGFLLCSAAIWMSLGQSATPFARLALYLWLWNPLVLWEAIGTGHNDTWMVLLMVLAVGRVSRSHLAQPPALLSDRPGLIQIWPWLFGLICLAIGGLFKSAVWVLGPLYLSAALRSLSTLRQRLWLLMIAGLLCVGLVVLAYLPFWEGLATLRHLSDRGSLFNATWLAALQSILALFLPMLLSKGIASGIGVGLLLFGCFWASLRAWSTPHDLLRHMSWLLIWMLLLCTPWFQPWYLLWVIALIALQPQHSHVWPVLLFSCTGMLSYGGEAFLLPALGWGSQSAEWHVLAWVLISGPPLLVFGWRRRAQVPLFWHALRRMTPARSIRRALDIARSEEAV